jgi:exopolysaccharide production protein ExoZ
MAKRGAINLAGVQILRGVATCLVLVHHVLEESQPLFGGLIPAPIALIGASGVDLFFAISGFIMFYTNQDSFGKEGAAADFFFRRVVRIVPLYWLCTLVVVATHAVGLLASQHITVLSLLSSLFFLPNSHIVHGVGWTLNYEMYFYAVFAIWLVFGTSRSGIFGILASIPLIMMVSWSLPSTTASRFLGNPIALEFCFGFALGVAFTRGWISAGISRMALLVGCAGLVLGTCVGSTDGTAGLAAQVRFLFWGLPATAILMSALSVGSVKNRLGKVILTLGNASYSIYLTHPFVMTTYAVILKKYSTLGMPRPVLMLVPVLASLAIGFATYHLVERPMTERLRLWRKSGPPDRRLLGDTVLDRTS